MLKVIHKSYPHTLKKSLNYIKEIFKIPLKKTLNIIIHLIIQISPERGENNTIIADIIVDNYLK